MDYASAVLHTIDGSIPLAYCQFLKVQRGGYWTACGNKSCYAA